MLERFLFHADGRLRTMRMVLVAAGLLMMALFGGTLVWLAPNWNGHPLARSLWVLFAVFVLKLPLIALCWWLIVRNKEHPGAPAKWSPQETDQIIAYLRAEARRALDEPDVEDRLQYLSRETWHVADRAGGTQKADAVNVALEIDRLLDRCRGPRRY
ncbi:MAG: hypothetical protein U0Y82_12795 [Thermoleophilia bacterium]